MRKELLLVSGLLVSSMAFAIDPVEIDSLINLKGVVVSANKIHVNRNSVPLSISVIEREEIEASSESALLPVLSERVPGLFVTEKGITGFGVSEGAAGTVNIRGVGQGNKVLMLFDGQPQWAGLFGHSLPDTYVADNASIPAVMNFGGGYYADYESIGRNGDDPRYPGVEIANTEAGSFGGSDTYNGGTYVVEAEGIYVGYKYFETRYYDAVANPDSGANSAAGATQAAAWDYNNEVLYDFGHGLSYLDYEQNLKSVEVDKTADGNITAVVELKNNSDQDGTFLAQLYVQQPYTEYDKENHVEKSAVMFLNSAKTEVAAGKTEEVTITIPTKYLASYDYTNAKTYILDEGDYYFTAAAGSHEAVNNILAEQGYTVKDGMDAEASGAVQTWKLDEFDNTTFAVENGTEVTNVAEEADFELLDRRGIW